MKGGEGQGEGIRSLASSLATPQMCVEKASMMPTSITSSPASSDFCTRGRTSSLAASTSCPWVYPRASRFLYASRKNLTTCTGGSTFGSCVRQEELVTSRPEQILQVAFFLLGANTCMSVCRSSSQL